MPELATGEMAMTPGTEEHLLACRECSVGLDETRKMMALLDEWQAPEVSPYFDVRLQARLREEMAKPQPGWFEWMRKPALAVALTLLLAVGGTVVSRKHPGPGRQAGVGAPGQGIMAAEPGTAVGDLQALDKNHDIYTDFDLLDEVQVQSDVTANP
jgi:hypothetical protein